mmetsp:Transcript_19111/g.31838  ORF Transcript_19111/g.31838 Transcript_19111/m.31838 type:complete len:424 (-) Transcript_19111:16-1287(-)
MKTTNKVTRAQDSHTFARTVPMSTKEHYRMVRPALALLALLLHRAEADHECGALTKGHPEHQLVFNVDDNHITLDGRLEESEWHSAEQTKHFVDIQGGDMAKPRFKTWAKMLWSDKYLYIGAYLEEPDIWANISETCHCVSNSTDQVIFHDNDFEVFVDPGATTHNYKEFEINSKNATWDLLLNKPYGDNGYENSSRVFGKAGFDMLNFDMKNAVYTNKKRNYWTVELALPIEGLLVGQGSYANPPGEGIFWRINFSRVEWHVKRVGNQYIKTNLTEDNWVWSPQGEIQMHLPERWGIIQFTKKRKANAKLEPYREWPIRQAAMAVYYAQHAFKEKHKYFASKPSQLDPFFSNLTYPGHLPRNFTKVCIDSHDLSITPNGFNATVSRGGYTAYIREDRFLQVHKNNHKGLRKVHYPNLGLNQY